MMNNSLDNFLQSPELLPFHLCVVTFILLSASETLGLYIGISPFRFLKRLIPFRPNNPLLQIKFSRTLILVFFLINFSFAGYFFQFAYYAYQQSFASSIYVLIPTLVTALFFTIFMIHCLDQVIKPKFIHRELNLLGRLATISTGSAKPEIQATARVRDEYGQIHYVMVCSEFGEIPTHTQVLLIRKKDNLYIVKKIIESNYLLDHEIFPK